MASTTFSGPVTITNPPLTVGDIEIEDLNEVSVVPQLVKLGSISGATSTGVKLGVANPYGANILIHGVFLVVTTQSTNANTVDIGVAANGTTSNDTLIDGASTQGTAPFVLNDQKNAGTNGAGARLWSSTTFVTVNANTDATGLVADLYAVISGLPA